MVTCLSANQLKTPANVSWTLKMVSQFGSLGYTIMEKTADMTVVQKTIIDILYKEGKPQTFIAKEAQEVLAAACSAMTYWIRSNTYWTLLRACAMVCFGDGVESWWAIARALVFREESAEKRWKTSQVTYVTMVPRVGNETLRPLGVATGNALSVTRSEDTYVKTPPVGRRQPMTSLPAYHNISAAGRIHHQLLRLKLASEAWLKAQGTQCLVPHSGNHGYIRNLRRSPSWELELRPLGVATGNVIPTSPCWGECKPISQKRRALSQLYPA